MLVNEWGIYVSKLISRRKMIQTSIGMTGGLFAFQSALAAMCGVTPRQTAGPFYPLSKITDNSINDLTIIDGHPAHAKGEVVYLTGTVQDTRCRPVSGVLVEIWTAAASGVTTTRRTRAGWRSIRIFKGGASSYGRGRKVRFKTIVPGAYPNDPTWTRANHVHFKVTRRGYREMVTQMYFTPESFEGDKAAEVARLNDANLILRDLPMKESVIVNFQRISTAAVVGPLLAYRATGPVKVGKLVARAGEKVGDFPINISKR